MTGLDDDERKMFQELGSKLDKDQVELNQILNSAIAQHAKKNTEQGDRFQGNTIGFSADISTMEPEPVYTQQFDYANIADEPEQPGEMDP